MPTLVEVIRSCMLGRGLRHRPNNLHAEPNHCLASAQAQAAPVWEGSRDFEMP